MRRLILSPSDSPMGAVIQGHASIEGAQIQGLYIIC